MNRGRRRRASFGFGLLDASRDADDPDHPVIFTKALIFSIIGPMSRSSA